MPVNKDFYTLAGSSGQSTGYTIDQSIRFNPSDSPVMTKTYSGAGDRTSWTWSCWFKLGSLNGFTPASNLYYQFFSVDEATNDTNRGSFHIINDSGVASATQFQFIGHSTVFLKTNRQFRDPSAWMHLVLVWDSDNTVASERARLYINGQRETSFATQNNPSSGQEIGINLGAAHRIGASKNISSSNIEYYFDGYMAEIHFLDGYSYGPEYFGEFDSNNIWIPKKYTGSYGTNGFKIDGRDSSDLGDDESGNGNDFTTSGLVATDKRTDSPTNNHATFNPLVNANAAYANGNVQTSISSAYGKAFMSFTLPNTGTWYWEGQEFNNVNDPATYQGIVDADVERLDDKAVGNRLLNMGTFTGITVYNNTGQSNATYEYKNGSETSSSGAAIISTSRLGFLWEPENNRLTIYDDGSQYQQFTSINAGNYIFGVNMGTGGAALSYRLFIEADDWTQTPSGITSANALNTKNIGS